MPGLSEGEGFALGGQDCGRVKAADRGRGMIEADGPTGEDVVSLAAMADRWLEDYRSRLCWGDDHVRKGRAAVLEFVQVTGARLVGDARRSHSTQYVKALLDRGLSRKTVANRLSLLRRFGSWLLEQEIRESNPWEVPLARTRAGDGATPFTAEEVRRIIEAARASDAAHLDRRRTGKLRADYYAILFLTGLRRKESRLQRWEHVDLDGGMMQVSVDKERRGDRIPLVPEAVEILRRLHAERRGALVFPRVPRDTSLRRDMAAAGVSGGRGCWHRFRKAGVTVLGQAGVPLRLQARFARHQDLRITATRYDMVGDHEARASMEALRAVIGTGGKKNARAGSGLDDESVRTDDRCSVKARDDGKAISRCSDPPAGPRGPPRLDTRKDLSTASWPTAARLTPASVLPPIVLGFESPNAHFGGERSPVDEPGRGSMGNVAQEAPAQGQGARPDVLLSLVRCCATPRSRLIERTAAEAFLASASVETLDGIPAGPWEFWMRSRRRSWLEVVQRPEVFGALCCWAAIPEDVLRNAAVWAMAAEQVETLLAVALSPRLPYDVLAVMAAHDDADVRYHVATHLDAQLGCLEMLRDDEDEDVRVAARQRLDGCALVDLAVRR